MPQSRRMAADMPEMPTLPCALIIGAVACFAVVVLTHAAEAFHIFPAMGWGLPNSAGHYLDLVSAVLGCTLLALGLGGYITRWRGRP
jgi:hypothetical protein